MKIITMKQEQGMYCRIKDCLYNCTQTKIVQVIANFLGFAGQSIGYGYFTPLNKQKTEQNNLEEEVSHLKLPRLLE